MWHDKFSLAFWDETLVVPSCELAGRVGSAARFAATAGQSLALESVMCLSVKEVLCLAGFWRTASSWPFEVGAGAWHQVLQKLGVM